MDPLTTSALAATITALLDGAAGEAGKSAWTTLTATARRVFGTDSAEVTATEGVDLAVAEPLGGGSAGLPAAAQAAAVQLLAGARNDPEFAEFLAGWQTTAGAIVQGADSVTNIVSGDVRSLIQARDIHGNINFG